MSQASKPDSEDKDEDEQSGVHAHVTRGALKREEERVSLAVLFARSCPFPQAQVLDPLPYAQADAHAQENEPRNRAWEKSRRGMDTKA